MLSTVLRLPLCALALCFSAFVAEAQSSGGGPPCPLAGVSNGQVVTVRGKVRTDPHNSMLEVPGCEDPLLLVFPWYLEAALADPTIGPRFRKDPVYRSYRHLSGQRHADGSWRYDIEVTITGRLDVSDGGELRKGSPLIDKLGKGGFGSPIPFTRYRVVALWMSSVVAQKRAPGAPAR
jgi:hypothetical protein